MRPSRRHLLAAGSASALLAAMPRAGAAAENGSLESLIKGVTGGVMPRPGGMSIEMPRISENGNAVPITVRVDSAMTDTDHVRWVHIIAERNPYPDVARFHLTRRAGRALVGTMIRMADTQQIVAVAAMNDGSFRMAQQEVIVTLSACVEAG